MIQVLSKVKVIAGSLVATLLMFTIVILNLNRAIDGEDGSGVLKLQLAFDKDLGIEIINSWGPGGVELFKSWLFTDYIYALTYSVFLASILSFMILKKGVENKPSYKFAIYLAFAAGTLDCLENTMELLFVNNPYEFSSHLFFFHSVLAAAKWLSIAIVIMYLLFLLTKRTCESS
jgi:hypothetical protein